MKLSRRSFLKSSMAMAATPLLPALNQLPKKRLITGSGEHTYEVHHDWLTPPPNIMWGDTHGLAVDRHSNIYVAHTVNPNSVGSDAVLMFNRHGKFERSWGAEFRNGAHGLDIRKEGNEEFLYHCDINRCLI